MPLTDEQRSALSVVRARYSKLVFPFGTAKTLNECARNPSPGSLPADVTVRVEIAPPSPQPHPLLPSNALKTPERVPIYFYTLCDDRLEAEAEPGPEEVADARVIFFIHGGGNVLGHPTEAPFVHLYTQLLHAVAANSEDARKCVLIVPAYRLATVPENAFPVAPQDLVAQNRPVELVEYDERPHGWRALAPISDDIQDAAQRIARFVLR